MSSAKRPRFDLDAVRELAGDKVFARGEAYHRGGQVRIVAIEPKRVLAQVEGTEDYRTELTGTGKRIGGGCSCPAFSDWGFCKHMVATALAANAAGDGAESTGGVPRIRDYLKKKDTAALVDMIVDLAERDSELFRKLDMAAAIEGADGKSLESQLRKAIDAATRTRDYVDYRKARGWAAGVDAVLDSLSGLVSGKRAGLVLGLAGHALERIEAAAGSIDDSDGHCGALMHRARDIHLAAARLSKLEPVGFARELFVRAMNDGYDVFADAAMDYADVLGGAGLAEYRRLAAEAWDKLPARSARAGTYDELSAVRFNLKNILDRFAEQEDDVETQIALRAKDLDHSWDYLNLAEFCLANGRAEEALSRAEEGLWVFEDGRPDERLVFFVADLLVKGDRAGDAEAHLWRAFEKAPSPELYERLRRIGGDAARDRALKLLEARLAAAKHSAWENPADLIVHIHINDKAFAAAWAAVRKYGVSRRMKEKLARASEKKHPDEALETHAECVEQLANTGGNQAYAEAVALIARMAKLRGADDQAAFVAALKERHGRKRNFMKLLG